MDPQEWQDIIKAHGGKIIGHKPLYTAQQISASQDLANPQPLPPYPPMEITFADGSTTEAILYGDGSVDQTKPIKPPPKGAANPTANRVLASGSSPSDKYIVTTDDQGNTHTELNPNYVPPKAPATVPGTGTPGSLDGTGGTPDLPVDVYNAQTERQRLEAANAKTAADQAAAERKFRYDAFIDQQKAAATAETARIARLNATDTEKTRMLNEWWKINIDLPKTQFDVQNSLLTTGETAGQNAATLAQMGTTNMVGPNFGANFADALTGLATGDRSKVHFGANDFTYQIPDYGAIAKNAAAAAIAHLSPYAASIAGTAAPSGYQPPAQQPGVVAAAANSVVAPNPSPVQPPPYRPAGFVG